MTEELLYRVVFVFSSGLGLVLAGGLSLLLAKKKFVVKAGATVPVAAAIGLVFASFVPPTQAMMSAGLLVLAVIILSVSRSNSITSTVGVWFARACRPTALAVMAAVAGAALMTAAIAHMTISEDAAADDDMQWMFETTYRPELDPVADGSAVTDRGGAIPLLKVHAPRNPDQIAHAEGRISPDAKEHRRLYLEFPPSEDCNCHGWVFTGGRYWLSPESVEKILLENGYHTVSDPRPGDVVIYRQGGVISHTAIVYTALPSRPIMVEGKWGAMGVYLHAIGECAYGNSYTFHRSKREGHVVAGLDGKPSVSPDHLPAAHHTNAVGTN
jgi:hypothetical protein